MSKWKRQGPQPEVTEASEPASVPSARSVEPTETPDAIQKLIDVEVVRHGATMIAAEETYKAKLAELLAKKSVAEIAVQRQLDAATAGNLKAVLAAVRGEDALVAEINANIVDGGVRRQAALRLRAAPALAQAAETRQRLADFDQTFTADLEAIAAVSRNDWILGTPAEAPGAHAAAACYTRLENGLSSIRQNRDALRGTLRTDTAVFYKSEVSGGFEVEIERLIDHSKFAWRQEDERAFVWAVTRLWTASPDSVGDLERLVKGVVSAAARLHELKQPDNTERPEMIGPLPEPGPHDPGFERPSQGEPWNVFSPTRA